MKRPDELTPDGLAVAPAGVMPPTAQPAPPHWGRQASLIAPDEPAFWLYVALLAIGTYFFYGEQSLMSSLGGAYLLSWLLVLVYAVPVAFVIYRLDLFEREPKILLAAALVWGGVIATSLAAEANSAWLDVLGKVSAPDFAAQWGKAIVGPGVEETLKLMGVAVLYLIASDEFDGPMDGFVYGAMIGLGFTVVEDVSYFINAVAAAPGAVDQSGPVFDTFIVRVVGGGLYGHVLFTGLTGTGFAYLVKRRNASTLRRAGALACIAAGVAAHVVWNSPLMASLLQTPDHGKATVFQWVEYGSAKGLPFLLLLVVLVFFATRSEESNFRAIVASESDPDVITEPEIRSLRTLLARRSARLRAKRQSGTDGARLTGRLQAAQIEYAMVRSRYDSPDSPEIDRQRQVIRGIRAQLEALAQGPSWLSSRPAAEPVASAEVPQIPAAPPAPSAREWSPTHLVPSGGMPAWLTPDPSQPPFAVLPERLDLVVDAWAGAWAHVRAGNGWRGWVDGRLLIPQR